MNDARHILEASQSIMLVDVPNTGVPRTLVEAGFTVGDGLKYGII
jgi:hypothetical protein